MASNKLDVEKLVRGTQLLIPVTLAYNGLAIDYKCVLFGTGAGVYALMRESLARIFSERTGAPRSKLQRPCWIKGYNGNHCEEITHATLEHLTVDGRRELNAPFLEVPNLTDNVIMGKLWLAKHDVDISARHNCLKWPATLKPSPPARDLKIPTPGSRKVDPRHQKDAERRNRLKEKNEQRRLAGRRVRILKGDATLEDDTLGKMQRTMEGQLRSPEPQKKKCQKNPTFEVNFLGTHEWQYGPEMISMVEIGSDAARKSWKTRTW